METETPWKPEVKKMSPEQLEKWTALRKKCQVFPSRKPYSRKPNIKIVKKKKTKFEKLLKFWYNIYTR